MRFQHAVILGCLVAWGLSLLSPPYPRQQWLQHVPTVLALAAMGVAARKRWLGPWSTVCLAAMLLIHIVGARWIYSYVPYDHWWEMLFGTGLNQSFGWERNHYDRFTHLAFGLLMTPPLCEMGHRLAKLTVSQSRWAAVLIVLAISALYEVFEWLLAVTAAPDFADRYNGQQGDLWDAQKDMALALLGSLFTTGCGMLASTIQKHRANSEQV